MTGADEAGRRGGAAAVRADPRRISCAGGAACSAREATNSLNLFVVWLALPALLFQALAEARFAELNRPGFVAGDRARHAGDVRALGGAVAWPIASRALARRQHRSAGGVVSQHRVHGHPPVPGGVRPRRPAAGDHRDDPDRVSALRPVAGADRDRPSAGARHRRARSRRRRRRWRAIRCWSRRRWARCSRSRTSRGRRRSRASPACSAAPPARARW